MLISAVSQACTPTLTSSRSPRPLISSGTRISRDSPPAQSASIRGETIAGRGAAAAGAVTARPTIAS